MDSVYRDLLATDSLLFYGGGRILTSPEDSSHYFFFTYYDELNDDDSQPSVSKPGEFGVFFAKTNEEGNFIWRKRLANSQTVNYKPGYYALALDEITDTTFVLSVRERKQHAPQFEDQDWDRILFFVIDSAGNELENYIFEDTQKTLGRYSLLKSDLSVIFPNLVSEYST